MIFSLRLMRSSSYPKTFGDALAEALDEDVGFRNRPMHYLKAIRILQIEGYA